MKMLLILTPIALIACSSSKSSTPATTTAQSLGTAGTTAPLSTPPTTPATTGPTTNTAAPTTQPSPPTTFSSVPQTFVAPVVFGSGPFTLSNTLAGLSELTSYTATLTLAFDGTIDAQPGKWSKTYVMRAAKDPAAYQVTIDKTGNLADLGQVAVATAGGVTYHRRGKLACTAEVVAADAPARHQFEPAGLLASLIGADPAGSDPLDGVPADHYTFDEHAIGLADQAKSTGEAWIATSGGYLLKYTLATTAKADYFGDGIEGTITWSYALTDVNKSVVPPPPTDCPSALSNVPLLPDATNVDSTPGVLEYTTATNLTDTAAFYNKALVKAGWKPTNEPTLTETSTALDFSQGTSTLTVSISTDSGVTTVTILAGDDTQA